ncbi:MAG: hypothetical protein SFV21_19895, partial [Rhodospirillaceae bacterium]|nr:hypothetical protein [Rhodospirillaceae bacterium]
MRDCIIALLAWLCAAATPSAAAEPTACDRLASHPEDPDRVAPPVETTDLDFATAIAACRAD